MIWRFEAGRRYIVNTGPNGPVVMRVHYVAHKRLLWCHEDHDFSRARWIDKSVAREMTIGEIEDGKDK